MWCDWDPDPPCYFFLSKLHVWSFNVALWDISLSFDEWRICSVIRLWALSDQHTSDLAFRFITLTLLYLHLLHVFPPLLSIFSFTGCWMVSVRGTLWFYSICKSLSWSWGLGPVRFRQLASRPTPHREGRYSATFGGTGVLSFFPATCLCPTWHHFNIIFYSYL